MNWIILLGENNSGKRGQPIKTSHAFITFPAKLGATYSVLFRSPEEIARLFVRITGMAIVRCKSISRRISKIVLIVWGVALV